MTMLNRLRRARSQSSTAIDLLLDAAGPALVRAEPLLDWDLMDRAGPLGLALGDLLYVRNGFYAFNAGLHVFPVGETYGPVSLARWNAQTTWRFSYGTLADGLLFFAEDLFGNQFCMRGFDILRFDAESGALEQLGHGLESWAQRVLDECDGLTGRSLARIWQEQYGPLADGLRLMPKVPFSAGGPMSVDNLCPVSAVEAMRLRGEGAQRLHAERATPAGG